MVTAVAASNTRTQHHRQGSIVGSLAITTALNGRRGLRWGRGGDHWLTLLAKALYKCRVEGMAITCQHRGR